MLPEVQTRSAEPPVVVSFADITEAARDPLRSRERGARQEAAPRDDGAGMRDVLDHDGDEKIDILLDQRLRMWPDDSSADPPPAGPPSTMALYRGDGRGRFTDVTNWVRTGRLALRHG